MTQLSIDNVRQIFSKKTHKLKKCGAYVTSIIVIDKHGNETELTLFADNKEALEIIKLK